MRLAIVGSIRLEGNEEATQIIQDVLNKYDPTVVVSGGAKGIDTMAADAAKVRGIEVKEYLPKTRRWHDGFKPRNILIAKNCDRLVRITAVESTTYGSGWTRDRAKEFGVPTEEYKVHANNNNSGE